MGFSYTVDRSRTTGFKCNYLRASLLTVLRVEYGGIVRPSSSNSEGMFCDGKARQPVDGTNGSELKLQFACNFAFSLRTFAENHLPSSILGSSV